MLLSNSVARARLLAVPMVSSLILASAMAEPLFIEKAGPPRTTADGVVFTYEASDAKTVRIAGDFNDWGGHTNDPKDPATAMEQAAPNGIWYKVVPLPSGHAEYKFVITDKDGKTEWVTDPFVPTGGDHNNSIYDPNNTTAAASIFADSAVRVLANDSKNELSVGFLDANGRAKQSVTIPAITMDGAVQTGLKADAAKPGRMANDTIWVEVAKAGEKSASVTWGANDGMVHTWELKVGSNDSYYGGGERFNSINQKGYVLPMRSMDHPGEKGAVSYKPVPFMMSSAGFGIWIDSFAPGTFDMNATAKSTCSFTYHEDKLRAVFIAGPKYADMLKEYTALTGRPPVPPAWSFGTWKSRNVHFNREEVLEDVEKYRALDIPASVLVIDSPWERGYNDFDLNEDQFSEPRKMFDRVDELGFYTCLWLTPFVNSENNQDAGIKGITKGASSNIKEASEKGYLVKNAKGETMITEWWKGKGGLVDFTNPDAVKWWMDQLDKTKEWGVKAWKCDDGEGTFVTDAVLHDGTRPEEMKGRFGYLYLETMQKYIDERMGGDGVLFARPGFAGTQKFPYCWAGDNHAGWDFENGLPGVIRAGQTAALSGISLWAHDISGYHGSPETQTPELFKRWTQFGCFTPMMQLHMTTNKGPWSFGDEGLAIYRKYAKLHTQLYPYIRNAAQESHDTGMPIIRPMILAFQGDDVAVREDFQYMFGPDILVAPIYQPVTQRSVYLPKGVTWIDWWTGEALEGGRYIVANAPIDRIPLYVRAGAVIPMLPPDVDTLVPRTEKMAKDVVTMDDRRIVQIWPGAESKATAEGISITATPAGSGVTLSLEASAARPLEVHLMHQKLKAKKSGADSAAWSDEASATVLTWKSFSGSAKIDLAKP